LERTSEKTGIEPRGELAMSGTYHIKNILNKNVLKAGALALGLMAAAGPLVSSSLWCATPPPHTLWPQLGHAPPATGSS